MARNGVQYEDVHRAIHQLLQQGEAPAVQRIREVLGTGSFTTISEHLRQWKVERAENRDKSPIQALPDILQRLTHELWQAAQEAAQQGLLQYREEADRQVSEAQQQTTNAQRQAEDAQQRETATANHLNRLQVALEEKTTALTKSEMQQKNQEAALDSARQKLQRSENRVSQLNKQNEAQSKEHHQALEEQTVEFNNRLTQEEQRHETAEARLMGLLDSVRQEHQEQEKQHATRRSQLERRLETLEKTLAEQHEAIGEAKHGHRQLNESLERYRKKQETLMLENQRLQQTSTSRKSELAELRRQLEEAQGRLANISLPPFIY